MYLTIFGSVPSKSNQLRPFRDKKGRLRIGNSTEAKAYCKNFIRQVSGKHRTFANNRSPRSLRLEYVIYMQSDRRDCHNSIKSVCDCLEKAGCVGNDRVFGDVRVIGHIDKLNPRVEIRITGVPVA